MTTIDEIKKKFLTTNPTIKMLCLDFPQGGTNTVRLSDILEKEVPKKYFLSEKLMKTLIKGVGENWGGNRLLTLSGQIIPMYEAVKPTLKFKTKEQASTIEFMQKMD